jgi:hypothetical protein
MQLLFDNIQYCRSQTLQKFKEKVIGISGFPICISGSCFKLYLRTAGPRRKQRSSFYWQYQEQYPKKVNKERKKTKEIKEIKDRQREMYDRKLGDMHTRND